MAVEPLVTVIVPTHDHAGTLDFALESVLTQTVDALELVVIGDGVRDDTRSVVAGFSGDPRVRFLDRAKSLSRAEEARHRVVLESSAPFVAYHGDDDLMLADHLETMVALLAEADFAHPAPVMIDADGQLLAHPIDLSLSECVAWQLQPHHSAISLTGVVHRRDAYLTLPEGWRTPPAGRHSDHYMWEQWLRVPAIRCVTGTRLTVLKLDSGVRNEMSALERRAEIADWRARSARGGFEAELARLVSDAWRRFAVRARLELGALEGQASA